MSGFRNFGTMLAQGFGGPHGQPGAFDRGVEEEMRARSAMDRARMVRDQAEQREQIEEVMRENGIDPSQAAIMGSAMRGGFANLPQAFSARDSMQGYDFREQIVDPQTDVEGINRRRAALGQSAFNPMQATGGQGQFFDVMNPEAGIQLSDLGQAVISDVQARERGRATRDTATADAATALAERRRERAPAQSREELAEQARTVDDLFSIYDTFDEAMGEVRRQMEEAITANPANEQQIRARAGTALADLRRLYQAGM